MTTFADITDQLATQAIELPSWAFGNSGTRFKVFGTPGTPRTVQEKIADAAQVHEHTGLAPKVALGSTILLMMIVLLWRPSGLYPVARR